MPESCYAQLIGSGSYVPDSILTNHDLEKMVETSDHWIQTRTGIVERHIASAEQSTSDLAVQASLLAIKDANITPQDIDLIIVATVTPDMLFPSTACFVQKSIGANRAVCFDISAACSGFVYAMSVAKSFIQSSQYKTILVIGAEVLSKFIDWEDRNTCVLFGDGAGAVILSATTEKTGILYSHLESDSQYTDFLFLPGGGSLFPANQKTLQDKAHTIKMQGHDVFKIAVNTMIRSAQHILQTASYSIDDISYMIPHQANIRIINAVAKRLAINKDKVYVNVDRYGNTSAATIPLALDELLKNTDLSSQKMLILCVAFGAGFTSGSLLIEI